MTPKSKQININHKTKMPPRLLLEEFALLFYIGKWCGVISYDYQEFRKYKRLKKSPGGDCFAIISVVLVFVNFNLMVSVFENSTYVAEKNTLTIVIGYVLTYFSLLTYMVDRVVGLLKQDTFIEIFDTLQELEEDFHELGLQLNNNLIRYRVAGVLLISTILEGLIFVFTFTFLVDRNSWSAWLWSFTAVPSYCSTLDKLWYNGIVELIRDRFAAINRDLTRVATNLQRQETVNFKDIFVVSSLKAYSLKGSGFSTKVHPKMDKPSNCFGAVVSNPQIFPTSMSTMELAKTNQEYVTMTVDVLEDRFVKLCQLHDGICGVAKLLNGAWSIQNLVIMGYGFFIIIAQLYFLYCAKSNQVIPSLFLHAQNIGITSLYLFYIAGKCIKMLHINWLTSLEAKYTAICMHRCALASDTDAVYEVVNHLSLKLFHHIIDFNACGYFSLDMATLFAFFGGITTYLIILVQFNMEEQQVKFIGDTKTSTLQPNGTLSSDLHKNFTSLFDQIYYSYINIGGSVKDVEK